MSARHEQRVLQRDVALIDVVDRLLADGVVLSGDITLSLADVDLLYLPLRLLIAPPEALGLPSVPRGGGPMNASPADQPLAAPPDTKPVAAPRDAARAGETTPRHRIDADPDTVERGLAQLVLTVIELLRQLMERQALRRVEAGGLDDETVERLGSTLMLLADRMEQLKATFGLRDEDLNINLGPLGRLL
ncbi:MAG: hypothetical protein QOD57_3756 [Actinomycetota bacterium]|nr:hypothetical protein [Actinomycetota bacterium]MDQ1506029.1 hypothetical protein [Actinomycetota bacterium]